MQVKLVTTKITPRALRLLRLVAAQTGDSQKDILERLLSAEAERVGLPETLTAG